MDKIRLSDRNDPNPPHVHVALEEQSYCQRIGRHFGYAVDSPNRPREVSTVARGARALAKLWDYLLVSVAVSVAVEEA
jgi:hypothetical protein